MELKGNVQTGETERAFEAFADELRTRRAEQRNCVNSPKTPSQFSELRLFYSAPLFNTGDPLFRLPHSCFCAHVSQRISDGGRYAAGGGRQGCSRSKNGVSEPIQVCGNGHAVNFAAASEPHRNSAYCPWCGASTFTECPARREKIIAVIGGVQLATRNVPPFCCHCGSPMPWTAAVLGKAEELLDLIDEITPGERQRLKACLPDLISDIPATPVAAVRIGKAMKPLEANLREAFRQIMFSLIAAKTQGILKSYGF